MLRQPAGERHGVHQRQLQPEERGPQEVGTHSELGVVPFPRSSVESREQREPGPGGEVGAEEGRGEGPGPEAGDEGELEGDLGLKFFRGFFFSLVKTFFFFFLLSLLSETSKKKNFHK